MSPLSRITTDDWRTYELAARQAGFFQMAAAPVHAVVYGDQVRSWVTQGFQADMHWYARSLEKRLDPRKVMPEVESIVMLSFTYESEPCTLAGKKLARYAAGDDYHDVLLAKLKALRDLIQVDYPHSLWRLYVDTGPILERYWAWQAGLGWIGKNGNLIHRQAGSYLFLAAMMTDLVMPYGQPERDSCGSCRACLDICPTDAFVAPGMLDSRRCISYLNIEHRGPFADAPAFDDWIFGCDLCQEVCPWTHKFSRPLEEPAFALRPAYEALTAETVQHMEQPAFSAMFRKSPIKRTKLAGLKRNLLHLMGTSASIEDEAPEPANPISAGEKPPKA